MSEDSSSTLECVDHLILARLDLDEGMDEVEQLLGVRPARGGRHPDWGSHNALLALGPRTYLEVVAPDPESTLPMSERPRVFTCPASHLLNGWVAHCSDLDRARAIAAEDGIQLGEPIHGRRARPDGRELCWSLTDPRCRAFDSIAPVLIDWGDSPHPAESAPEGCRLGGLRLEHPEADRLARLLGRLRIPIEVVPGESAAIHATIEAPNGTIHLE